MQQLTTFLIFILFSFSGCSRGNNSPSADIQKKPFETTDTTTQQVHPVVKQIFYDLPLEKSRLELRETMIRDQRFVSTTTTFNDYEPSSFFKGITSDKGLVISKPDSTQVMLFLGNASLSTVKGGEPDFKDIMLLSLKYFYSSEGEVDTEHERILHMLHPILPDSTSERSESPYTNGNVHGRMTVVSEILQNFNPYYRVGISCISEVPSNNSKSVHALEIVFAKEDK